MIAIKVTLKYFLKKIVIDIYCFIKRNINARWIKLKTISEFVFSFCLYYKMTVKIYKYNRFYNITYSLKCCMKH